MFLRTFIGLLILLNACGQKPSSVGELPGTAMACTAGATLPGMICLNNTLGQPVWTPLMAGYCNANANAKADCPPPYNSCDTNNRCAVASLKTSDSRIWFATSAIRPGITRYCNDSNPNCTVQNDYVYNIMAKGTNSLNNFCMSEAQKSSLKAVRSVNSWTAMVASTQANSQAIIDLWYNVVYSSNNPNIVNPVKTAWSTQANTIYDKNGVAVAAPTIPSQTSDSTNYWSGLANEKIVARAQTQGCSDRDDSRCFGWSYAGGLCTDLLTEAGTCNNAALGCMEFYNPYVETHLLTGTDQACHCGGTRACCYASGTLPTRVAKGGTDNPKYVYSAQTVQVDFDDKGFFDTRTHTTLKQNTFQPWSKFEQLSGSGCNDLGMDNSNKSNFPLGYNYGAAVLTPGGCVGGIVHYVGSSVGPNGCGNQQYAPGDFTQANRANPIICMANAVGTYVPGS